MLRSFGAFECSMKRVTEKRFKMNAGNDMLGTTVLHIIIDLLLGRSVPIAKCRMTPDICVCLCS